MHLYILILGNLNKYYIKVVVFFPDYFSVLYEGGLYILLSPATKWKGDIGMGAVRPSFRPSVRHVSFPEQNTKTVRDILTKLGT